MQGFGVDDVRLDKWQNRNTLLICDETIEMEDLKSESVHHQNISISLSPCLLYFFLE
jgi:Fe-S cluster biosynthesis and repair protein YggX